VIIARIVGRVIGTMTVGIDRRTACW